MSVFLLFFIIAIFLANWLGVNPDGGYIYWWYDIPMHIAGGAWVAAAFLYFAKNYGWLNRIVAPTVVNIFAVVFIVGFGWEIFEHLMDVFAFWKYEFLSPPPPVVIDTIKDFINNLIGAALVAWVWMRHRAATA